MRRPPKTPRAIARPEKALTVAGELRRVREELAALTAQVHSMQAGDRGPTAASAVLPLPVRVFFSRQSSERKPFRIEIEGAVRWSEGLSHIRAAIFLVTLLDLRDRLEGGTGAPDMSAEAARIAGLLDPKAKSTDPANVMRVAFYRFFDYFEEHQPLKGIELTIGFDVSTMRLNPVPTSGEAPARPVQLQIGTNDPQIEQILSTSFHSSPLATVKRRGSLYVPSGPAGSDRLLLEMYNHSHKLQVTSLYVRPPFQSYPENLLQLIGTSERTIERKRIAFEGYRDGRFHFLEILPKYVIWNLIRCDKQGRFKLYPPQVKTSHVLDHLDNLIYILKHFENYEFFVTDANIPFACVTYQIHSGVIPECYSVFFQSFDAADERDLGCFVLNDPHVFQSISDHIVQWVVSHQSTIRERAHVIKFLQKVRRRLDSEGPLSMDEPIPS